MYTFLRMPPCKNAVLTSIVMIQRSWLLKRVEQSPLKLQRTTRPAFHHSKSIMFARIHGFSRALLPQMFLFLLEIRTWIISYFLNLPKSWCPPAANGSMWQRFPRHVLHMVPQVSNVLLFHKHCWPAHVRYILGNILLHVHFKPKSKS